MGGHSGSQKAPPMKPAPGVTCKLPSSPDSYSLRRKSRPDRDLHIPFAQFMLSAPTASLTFEEDDWKTPPLPPKYYRAASVGSWGVTSIGRGFDWNKEEEDEQLAVAEPPRQLLETVPQHRSPNETEFIAPKFDDQKLPTSPFRIHSSPITHNLSNFRSTPAKLQLRMPNTSSPTEHFPTPSLRSRPPSPPLPLTRSGSAVSFRPSPVACSPSSPRPRRRSSQQRVSLIAGRVSIAPIEPPSSPPLLLGSLSRAPSSSSASTCAPSPSDEKESFLGGRSISEFSIEGEIGRGAYGLVKRAREIHSDGTLGPPLVIKQIIKSRILADCWKKHPKHGTIPIEIYVMSAISSTSYVLPPRRPWDPARFSASDKGRDAFADGHDHDACADSSGDEWIPGKVVQGHPNICPLDDFFEDNHYYYLVLPSTTPEQRFGEPSPPSDLFDLVENYPQGLPASLIRSYLGQIADALCFLHSQGIVHRDVKDENVVLGPKDKCILIDFGSSGLVKKGGWDTFSGTLDYAGPEILRGERYYGKEQDVWAFGVVAYVLLVGECPFMTAAEAQDGLESPFANASITLDERCGEDKEKEGEEKDGGGSLGDAATLVRACLQVEVSKRPTFEKILQSRFLSGDAGW